MKWIFAVCLFLTAFLITLCPVIGARRIKADKNVGKSVRALLLTAACVLAANAAAVLIPSERGAMLAYGLHYIFTNFMLIYLLEYTRRYTGLFRGSRAAKITLYCAYGVDVLIMLGNVFTGTVFSCELAEPDFGGSFYKIAERGELYNFHIAFEVIISMAVLITLAVKISRSPKIYRGKYITVLGTFLIVIAANIAYLIFNFTFDYSLIFYAEMAFSIFYFSLVYVPNGLIESLLALVATNLNDTVMCFDLGGKCVHANAAARGLFKISENDYSKVEKYHIDWLDGRDPNEISSYDYDESHSVGGEMMYFAVHYRRMLDGRGRYIGCFFILHNRTDELRELEAQKYRATHDKLTGVYNKEFFYEQTELLLKENPDTQYCIICSDVKNFKLINDMFGTKKGDEIIKAIAEYIASKAKDGAVFGRISGDRFALCMPKSRYSERLLLHGAEKMGVLTGSDVYRIHIHFGVYDVTDRNIQVSVMCGRARLAIKTIKNSYQDVIAYYDDDLRNSSVNEQKLIGEFDEALESGQFGIFLQPQISVEGRVLGAEALVRWAHPERGLIQPGEFITVFEQTGLISRLDLHVWELACARLKEWKDAGKGDFHISVNISPKDFFFTDIYETFTGLVEKYGIDPHMLKLEITETAIMADLKKQLELIARLRDYGFAVEIDDFGSGYSSLNTLKDMNVDTLKIDMGFLRKTSQADRTKAILQMIISLSKKLGMEVVTEGVETREQVDFLTEFGCDIFQGYYFAKPMPVADFEDKYFPAE